MRKHIEKHNIDISHFGINKKTHVYSEPKSLQSYLDNEYPIRSFDLKSKLLKANLLKKECSCCQLTKWMNQDIPLELDHIDGNNQNNNLSNLRLLCINCHMQTPTWGSKRRPTSSLLS